MIDWLRASSETPSLHLAGRDVPVAIRRDRRARRLTLRLSPDGSEVRLTVPAWARTAEALAFAKLRSAWLETQLAKVPQYEPPGAGGTMRFRGTELAIDWREGTPRRVRLDEDRLTLGGPEDTLAKRIQRWLEEQALALFAADLTHYCDLAAVAAPKIALSRAQRRWGSCSTSGTVRINWRLVQAPDFVRRSVVAHEVAHLVHFDHSPAFHALLARLFEGDIAEADRWLKRHGRSLYASFG
ncbi:M48 family metallopeptidase [Altererythrobacter sp. CAU 1778]